MTMLFLKHPTCWPEVRTTVSIIAAPSEIKIGLAREVTFSADCCSGSVGQSFWICPSVVLDLPALHHVRLSVVWPHADDVSTGNETPGVLLTIYFRCKLMLCRQTPRLPTLYWPLTPYYIDILIALSDQCLGAGGNDAHPMSLACRFHVQCHRDPASDWFLPASLLQQP